MAHGRPVFQSPPDRREEAELAKKLLTGDSAAARSDHLALVAAFSEWNQARTKDGRQAAYQVTKTRDPWYISLLHYSPSYSIR